MKPTIDLENAKVFFGNCLDVLPTLADNSVDAIVTDAPYELGFMGKSWDNSGIAYNVDVWRECLRVLKPGGHILAFGGSRTWHRLAVAIEDSGFEMRDSIAWLYGSGFPKSHNVAKASKRDRNEGLEELPEVRHADRNATDGVGGDNPRNRTNQAKQNFHPTVKPTALMQYLIRLVTPNNGVVLDPFAGSGSTGKAAILEGFSFIGIELTEEYLPIIEGRLQHAINTSKEKGDDLFASL